VCGAGGAAMGMQIVQGVLNAGAAYSNSKASKTAYNYQATVARNNAQVDEYRAEDAIERGHQAEFRRGLAAGQIEGSQRARFAASGLSLTDGSPLNVLADTKYMGGVDRETTLWNADREAYALRVHASNDRSNAALLQMRADATPRSICRTTRCCWATGTSTSRCSTRS
jgi:hypothetical protein